MTRFDWLYLAASPLVLPVLGWRRLARGKYRESAAGMLGRGPQWKNPKAYPGGTVWMHAVSAGEVTAAKAVAPHLKSALPQWPLVASTVTETGQAAARRSLTEAEEVFYFPLDLSWNVRKFIARFRPRVAVLFEAELWPNFLLETTGAGAAVFLLNGRMSERSFARYRKLRTLLAPPLRRIRAFCMQTEDDAARVEEIVGRRDHVFVTGNCKFDADFPTLAP
ncbi:MAG: 3-deoxy-D-manno-octulosonic acid transferase, partial [Candidatus Sumerlaeota bacterium]|nr:3-deoxy-D-manno-octulosonic acid transferase [Candidatus Sumerlaeota bacterium]